MTVTSGTAAGAALASSLRMSLLRISRRLRAERTDSGLSLSALAALATLVRQGPLSPGELADQERVQPPSMTRTIAALELAQLVVRTPHPTDRRQVRLAASPAGVALIAADRRRRDAWLSRRLARLSREEVAVLAAAAPILDRLAQQ